MTRSGVTQRLVLPDCCEDWILSYGSFYRVGDAFACPECTAVWGKVGAGRFERQADRRRFARWQHESEGAVFPYLAPEDGPGPILERCCAQMLLRYAPITRLRDLRCPICRASWQRTEVEALGIRVAAFAREGLPEPLVLQAGAHRTFLVPLSHFSPPRDG